MTADTAPGAPTARQMRTTARLHAVQALFQMEASGQGTESVIRNSSIIASAPSTTATR